MTRFYIIFASKFIFSMKRILSIIICLIACYPLSSDEGMWMLNNLKESNWNRMKELGFTLTEEQLYDTVAPSLKDAVIHFGGGCTGITVSEKGLLFTNHHCGYGAIQSQSSVEHDYLRDGFVARSMEEELPIEGLFVRYLLKSIDVTDEILSDITPELSEKDRMEKIREKMKSVENVYSNDSLSIEARVNAYFANNTYYLNIYEVLTDVRLVFAPPTSIGKFGGDTDNWMWPRHTGDFSVFRIYQNPEKKKGYHQENIPFKPKYVAPVSMEGFAEDSFAMIIGYPGRTNRYLCSWGVEQRVKSLNDPRIEVRGIKQDIWKEAMMQSDAVRIKYSSKYAGSSNYWKNSIGMNRGVEKMHVIERKKQLENDFQTRLNQDSELRTKYGEALTLLETAYTSTDELQRILTYLNEAFNSGTEIIRMSNYATEFKVENSEDISTTFHKRFDPIFKDYEAALDEKVLAAMMKIVKERVPANYLPGIYKEADKKHKGNYEKYASDVFKKSAIVNQEKLKEVLLDAKKDKKLEKDPVVILAQSVRKAISDIRDAIEKYSYDISKGERLFMAGLMEMNPDINYPSDANSTMRITYGSIKGYVPFDGAWYDYYTTQKGVFEKYKKEDYEFHVQDEILAMLAKKNFGFYGNEDGNITVNFLSDNDITGGNSGSPVFDAKGRVIGLAFDGNWEAMSGDIVFETEVQRCINVDMRYILYIIDKWGNCRYLLEELRTDS